MLRLGSIVCSEKLDSINLVHMSAISHTPPLGGIQYPKEVAYTEKNYLPIQSSYSLESFQYIHMTTSIVSS